MPDGIERLPNDRPRKRVGTDLLAADVHARLRAKILTFEIKPGTRLVEDEISSSLDVGRTPVREALLRLQGEGLVSREKGWVVECTDAASIDHVFESRVAIEGYATHVAALRATPADIRDLRALAEEMDGFEAMGRAQLNLLNRRFHERIVGLSGNPFFVEMHERTQFHYWNMRLPVLFTREQAVVANEQHKRIVDALEARDPDTAERHAREHVETTHRIVRDALDG
ncbi:GntR family transcriptional regulator [Azospirillum sp. YIM DDC1]|uniref:GntR family transcriptional regulator n=1 Tax=Azospirillum aestuarii TaxID=2802052 RepID=A0ABS1I8A8_9PROT|nr:GntR family transcriptional regulator [Azospirillum aestuarii]MBK4723316.1 GntR family transcriptional regulator [Azospirillum aestuarii]